jgi:hypothetical protein
MAKGQRDVIPISVAQTGPNESASVILTSNTLYLLFKEAHSLHELSIIQASSIENFLSNLWVVKSQ